MDTGRRVKACSVARVRSGVYNLEGHFLVMYSSSN